ncbi:MAG: hypothetical protein KGQ66_17325 [Acidobacteriota bacterium]|nr:hypothetical protein [Acidobacteriota bacterium]
MSFNSDEPPEQTEVYENLDEALDDADLPGHGRRVEGERDVEDLVADRVALHEVGADLDDPDRLALLEGAMDDPDGAPIDLRHRRPSGSESPEDGSVGSVGGGDSYRDAELEFVEVDPADMEQIPDDAPGPDSARW